VAAVGILVISSLLVLGVGCGRDSGRMALWPDFDLEGHRGARGLQPENTLQGFRAALAIGVTTLEMDVGISRDGVAVVHHDEGLSPAIARGKDGRWLQLPTPLIRQLTSEQLLDYDVGRIKPGSPYAARFPHQQSRDGSRILRLADVIAEAERISGGKIHYNIETKLSPEEPSWTVPPADFVETVVQVIRATGIESRSQIQSFDFRTLRYVSEQHPDIRTACLTTEESEDDNLHRLRPGPSPWTAGLDIDEFDGSTPHLVEAAGCAVWSPFQGDLNAADMARARTLGLKVIPWTVNEREEIEELLDLAVDGIISDYPDRVRNALSGRGMPLPTQYGDGG
jgi:glycerophosphoryl diester phosphodiesterase